MVFDAPEPTGQAKPPTFDEVDLYARDLSQIGWDLVDDNKKTTVRRDGKVLRLTSVQAGRRQDQTLQLPADFSSDLGLYADVLKGALKPGDTRTDSTLDAEKGELYTETTTVGPPETLQVMGRPQRCWTLTVADHRDGSELRVWLNAQGDVVKSTSPTLPGMLIEEVSQTEALQ